MASNEDQIRSVVQRFSEAWNRNNGAEVGAFFTEDGCLINPFGERANGRASVGEMYTRYFGGILHGTTTAFSVGTIRMVEQSHAFLDGDQVVHAADGSVLLQVHVSALMRRETDGWRFVDARPHIVATRPA